MTHKGELALPKYWKTLWKHELKTGGHPELPAWAGLQRARSPRGRACDDWVYRSGACPCSRGGHRRTLRSSSPTKYSRPMAHPHHAMGYTCPTRASVQESSARYRSCRWLSHKNDAFVLAVLEACLIMSWRRCWPPLRQRPAVDHQNSVDALQPSPSSCLKKSVQWGR